MLRKKSWVMSTIMAVILLSTASYASSGLMVKSERTITPKQDQAVIVFMRPRLSIGKEIWTGEFIDSGSVFDVSGNSTKLVGIIKTNTKISFDVAPGEYTFMVIGESADFMKAIVTVGKIYYVRIAPRTGLWKARFSFQPLRQSDLASTNFIKWDSITNLVESTPAAEVWAKRNAPDIESKRADYWPSWSEKPLEQREKQTLKSEDGR